MTTRESSRRSFLQSSGLTIAAAGSLSGAGIATAHSRPLPMLAGDGLKGRLWKTLKFGMVNVDESLTSKFKAVKAAGYDGIEMDSPGMNVGETRKAIVESGLPVDWTVNSTHWQIRHTDVDAVELKRIAGEMDEVFGLV